MPQLDEIRLEGLRVFGHHGVFDHERGNGQDFVIDLVLSVSAERAAQTDDVADTVHYGEVADAVAQIVAGDPVNLIETLAEHIADRVLAFPGVFVVRVTMHKPQAPIQQQFTDVSVTITRERAEAGE